MPTEIDLDSIRERERKATAGPWYSAATRQPWTDDAAYPSSVTAEDGTTVFAHRNWKELCANLNFAVQARADIPALLAYVDELRAENERLRGSRRVYELDNHHNALACGYCSGPLKDALTQAQAEIERLRKREPNIPPMPEDLDAMIHAEKGYGRIK